MNINNSAESPPKFGATLTTSSRRPPINLYPSPGKLPGSRKRKSSSRHGPQSASYDHSGNDLITGQSGNGHLDSQLKQNYLSPDLNNFELSGCPSPHTPNSMAHSPGCEMRAESHLLSTPRRTDNTTSITESPLSREMSVFRNLSLRSPKLSKSPGSSFSQYTRSANTFTLTATSHSSFDSCELSKCASPFTSPLKPSTPQSLRTVPLTVISDSRGSRNMSTTGSTDNKDPTSSMKRYPQRSPQLVISPRPHRPSKFLMPSPKTHHLPFPRLPAKIDDVNADVNAPIESLQNKQTSTGDALSSNDVHPSSMMPPLPNKTPNANDQPKVVPTSCSPPIAQPMCPPPIKMLSFDLNQKSRKEKKLSNLKRKTALDQAVSLFKPSADEARNEFLYSNDGDTDGSLSDYSDDEGAFFLSDPSCLNLKPKFYKSSSSKNGSSNNDNNFNNLSLAAAYSFMGSSSSSKKKKRDDSNHGIYNQTFSTIDSKFYSSSRNKSNDSLFSDGRDKSSATSLFGMNIIHENSASNASIADMSCSLSRNGKNGSYRNLSDQSSKDSYTYLNRSKSNQSINSLGLCLDSSLAEGFEGNRDMITPPIISRPLSSPPPLKQTALTIKNN